MTTHKLHWHFQTKQRTRYICDEVTVRTFSCVVLGLAGKAATSVDVQDDAAVSELAKRIKHHCLQQFKDVNVSRMKLFGTQCNREHSFQSDRMFTLVPEYLAEGKISLTQSVASRWVELDHSLPVGEQLPLNADEQTENTQELEPVFHVVAIVPTKTFNCEIIGQKTVSITINESALVGDLKDLIMKLSEGNADDIKLVSVDLSAPYLEFKDDIYSGRYPLMKEDVDRERVEAVKEEVDLTQTIRAAFGDNGNRGDRSAP